MKYPYFTADHETFRDSVRKFVAKEITPQVETWEHEHGAPKSIYKKLGEMGYLGINYPESLGGCELDFFHSVVFLEEMARCGAAGLAAGVGVSAYMATPPLLHLGSDYIKEEFLAPAIAGNKIAALAITEPNAGSDVEAMRTTAVKDGDFYVVNGSKTFITNGCNADFVTLAVKTDRNAGYGGISLLVVDSKTPGFRVSRKLDKLGWWSSDTAELSFENMRVPAKNLLGQEGMGFKYIMNNFQLERLVAAITSCGGCDIMLAKTLDYMSSREAFGRPLAKFQVLRHKIAQLYTELEAARSLTYQCADGFGRGQYLVKEITMAKLYATELAVKTATECLQVYGGYGAMEEYPMARAYRDSRIGTIAGGTSEVMREILCKVIFDGLDFQNVMGSDAPADEMPAPKPAAKIEPPKAAPAPSSAGITASSINSVADLMGSLSARFLKEKASDFTATVHLCFAGANGGNYTVTIANGSCSVEAGLNGSATCKVDTDADTYLGIEKGTVNPQMAFMAGKVKVSNIGVMMKFMTIFQRLGK